MAPKFFMMVGIAGSGKSTVASKIAASLDGCLVLSSDAIRGELYSDETVQGDARRVFQLMEERTMEALKEGRSVIYDATNILAWRRQKLLAKLPLGVEKICLWVNVPMEQALQNNQGRARHVPEWVIRRQAEQLEEPTKAEGWNEDPIEVIW